MKVLCRFVLHILIKKRSTPTVTVGETKTLYSGNIFPLSLSPPLVPLSQCIVGGCRPCRGDLLPCCTVLCWQRRWVQCQGHLSDKQSRCLTLTNSPTELGWPPRQSCTATSAQSAETCSHGCKGSVSFPLTTTASTQSTLMGHSLLFVCSMLQPLSPAAVALHMIVFGNGKEAIVNMQLVFLHNGAIVRSLRRHVH